MQIWQTIVQWYRALIQAIDRKLIIPTIRGFAVFFSNKLEQKIAGIQDLADWKQKALEDFKFWLSDLPDIHAETKSQTPDGIDLYTLLAEFAALRQDIHQQSAQQEAAIHAIEALTDKYDRSSVILQERAQELGQLEKRLERIVEKKTVIPFLEIRQSLVRGHETARTIAETKRFMRSVPKGVGDITEGYETAIRQFDQCLEVLGILPIETEGKLFDPKTMKKVDEQSVPDTADGMVLKETARGFIFEDEVLKMAEVVVNRVETEADEQ